MARQSVRIVSEDSSQSMVHAFVLRDLFPNDLVIVISNKKPRQHHHRKWFHMRRGSSDEKEIEHYLKFSNSDVKDIESSLDPTTSSSLTTQTDSKV
ncbi:hypothetical protein NC651_028256 [Populus alba x Populus x berolinensis]|nr:hypothetical protein NC651_028256 [Populus alba x Populus x berolinensis]